MKSLVYFRDEHILIGRILLVVFAVAFVLTIADRVRQVYRLREIIGIGGYKRTAMDQDHAQKRSVSATSDYPDGYVLHISLVRLRRRLDQRQDSSLHFSGASSIF